MSQKDVVEILAHLKRFEGSFDETDTLGQSLLGFFDGNIRSLDASDVVK